MATARKLELNALLNPIQKTVSGLTSSVKGMPALGFGSGLGTNLSSGIGKLTNTSGEGGMSAMLFGFAFGLFVIFLVLLIIHYSITPIFSFTAGDGGAFPLANTTDGQLVWTKEPPLADMSANVIRILPHSFSVQQDIYIDNELTLSNRKRVFFYRSSGPVVVDTAQPEDLLSQYPESNLFMYLSPNTNDLIVTAVTKKPNGDLVFESAPTILNVPVKQVIRLTVVFLPQVLEVYLNGKLHGTRTFRYTPLSTNTYFFSTPDAFRGTVRVMNLKYWDRPLMATEVSKSSPPLTDKALYSPDEMATAQCK
jgi:hypothetical protein